MSKLSYMYIGECNNGKIFFKLTPEVKTPEPHEFSALLEHCENHNGIGFIQAIEYVSKTNNKNKIFVGIDGGIYYKHLPGYNKIIKMIPGEILNICICDEIEYEDLSDGDTEIFSVSPDKRIGYIRLNYKQITTKQEPVDLVSQQITVGHYFRFERGDWTKKGDDPSKHKSVSGTTYVGTLTLEQRIELDKLITNYLDSIRT